MTTAPVSPELMDALVDVPQPLGRLLVGVGDGGGVVGKVSGLDGGLHVPVKRGPSELCGWYDGSY